MKRLIFRLTFFFLIFIYSFLDAQNIITEYEIVKNDIDAKSITTSQNYFFASSYSIATAIEDTDIESNKMIANAKFLDHLSTLVDWPTQINSDLKLALWNFYINQKKFTFKKSQIVDNGKLGEYYYVVVGIPKSELLKVAINYSQIINLIKK